LRPDLNNYDQEADNEITEKYTEGPDKLAENVPLKHPNRNTEKKRDKTVQHDQQQQDEPKHGRTGHTAGIRANDEARDKTRGEQLAGTIAPEDDALASGVAPQITGMQLITSMDKDTFTQLASHPADVCVTVYVSTHSSGEEKNQGEDKRALKDALQQVRHSMEQLKIQDVIDDILEPAENLLKDDNFWHAQARGLALFLAPDIHSCCLLPYDPGNETHVHTSFILTALAPMLNESDGYFLLTISKHSANLYQGHDFELIPIAISEMPDGMGDVVHYEEKGDSGVFRAADGSGGGGANYHGVGAGKTEDKDNMVQYFREVDKTLRETVLGKSNLPLLLAGVEYELPLYRRVNTYPHLIKEELTGNFEHLPLSALFEKAQQKMNGWFEEQRNKTFQNKADHGTVPVTAFTQDVIRAAYEGRVAQLFIAKGPLLWGQYTSRPEEPIIHEQQEAGDDCLTNQALVQTLLHGGAAYMVDKEKMPMEGQMVAVLRY